MAETAGGGSLYNATLSLLPSPADLAFALPRLAQRAGTLVLGLLAEDVNNLLSAVKYPFSTADATTPGIKAINQTLAATTDLLNATITVAPDSIPTWPPSEPEKEGFIATLVSGISWQRLGGFDGIFSYLASRWAVSTFIIAIILNRTHVYASARRHLRLNWQTRMLIRVLPIALFVYQVRAITETMRCQTGTFLAESGVTDKKRLLNGAYVGEGGLLFKLSSALLFWETEEQSCVNAKMVPSGNSSSIVGSSSVLWPLFISLCISHFMETISCALQGQRPQAETGMNLFEHSLAFAEAEAVMRSSLGYGMFDFRSPISTTTSAALESSTASAVAETSLQKGRVSRGQLLRLANVPPEILLIATISSLSHLSTHALAVLGLQSRCRLVNTTLWGLCFMLAFVWSFFRFSFTAVQQEDVSILRYPTVCIIGFIPHLVIILGTLVCAFIYGFALLITVLSPPTGAHSHGSFFERLHMAHENLQAHASLSTIRFSWEDEFFTTLLKVGFGVLTAASEAVYFNEGASVNVTDRTWLEEKRLYELECRKLLTDQLRAAIPAEIQGDSLGAGGLNLVDEERSLPNGHQSSSGYARERKTTMAGTPAGAAALKNEGAGGSQRGGRLFMSWQHVKQVFRLSICVISKITMTWLRKIGIERFPSWLQRYSTLIRNQSEVAQKFKSSRQQDTHTFWILSEDGQKMQLPRNLDIDVEVETRRRLAQQEGSTDTTEQAVDTQLYRWWRLGGWWGDVDNSGDYQPASDEDDDTTSVISTVLGDEDNSTEDSSAWESEVEDGRRTPTQEDYSTATTIRRRFRSPTPGMEDEEEPMARIARLLDPKTLAEKQEARLLSRHLATDKPLTRSRYQAYLNSEKLRLVAPGVAAAQQGLSQEEEEDLLEQIILSRRRAAPAAATTSDPAQTWAQGASGLGENGPESKLGQRRHLQLDNNITKRPHDLPLPSSARASSTPKQRNMSYISHLVTTPLRLIWRSANPSSQCLTQPDTSTILPTTPPSSQCLTPSSETKKALDLHLLHKPMSRRARVESWTVEPESPTRLLHFAEKELIASTTSFAERKRKRALRLRDSNVFEGKNRRKRRKMDDVEMMDVCEEVKLVNGVLEEPEGDTSAGSDEVLELDKESGMESDEEGDEGEGEGEDGDDEDSEAGIDGDGEEVDESDGEVEVTGSDEEELEYDEDDEEAEDMDDDVEYEDAEDASSEYEDDHLVDASDDDEALDDQASETTYDTAEEDISSLVAEMEDANLDTVVHRTREIYSPGKLAARDTERIDRLAEVADLAQAGWSGPDLDLYRAIHLRGLEPLMPREWAREILALPYELFTENDEAAFIRSRSRSPHGPNDMLKLMLMGGYIRSLFDTEHLERRFKMTVRDFETWTLTDIRHMKLRRWKRKKVLTLAVITAPKFSEHDVLMRKTIRKFEKMEAKWKVILEGTGRDVPPLYAIIHSGYVTAIMAYVPDHARHEGLDDHIKMKTIAFITTWDQREYDVWNAFAIAIVIVHARNVLMKAVEGFAFHKEEESGDDL